MRRHDDARCQVALKGSYLEEYDFYHFFLDQMMLRTIVLKSARSQTSSDIGTVIPVAIENEDGTIKPASPANYPNNNRIFISKEFSRIDEAYDEGELFFLSVVNENRDYIEDEGNPSRSRYYSMGFYAAPLETNTYLPIVSMQLPNIASGRVDQAPPLDVGSKPFFIRNNGKVVGPFLGQAEGDTWLITPTNTISPLSLASYHVAEFFETDLHEAGIILAHQFSGTERLFFTSLKRAKDEIDYQAKDYIPDSALVRLFAKNDYGKGVGNLSKAEANKLAGVIDAYSKKIKITSDDERRKRVKLILNEYIKFEGVGTDVMQEYLNSKPGKEFVEKYTAANREILFKDTIAAIEQKHSITREKLERETAEIAGRLDQKKQELSAFELDIERKKTDIVEKMRAFNAQTKEQEENALKDRHNKVMAEIASSEKALDDLKSKVGEYKEISTRKNAVSKLEVSIEYLQEREEKLKRSVQTQMNLIGNPQISEKLVEFRTIQQLLNGISPNSSDATIKSVDLPKYSTHLVGESRKTYISDLKGQLDQSVGRHYTYDEVANLLLCLLQSYLTVFAGPPGTGKTSTATRLADALGLTTKHKNALQSDNFLSISVGRGWMSSRELLGFYNSLKNVYQPSRSGLYNFLTAVPAKESETHNDFLKMVLLDEANLSSLEHYWSDFLLLCDTFEGENRIDLGMGIAGSKENYINLPSSLRFVATINNDATVESLSPRLINRAAIVGLDYDSDSSTVGALQRQLMGAVPYKELTEAFCPNRDEEELRPIETLRLKQVLEILGAGKGTPIQFSRRKINAISRYCFAANQLEFEKTEPLDFAISQHILPAISGQGTGLREKLKQLELKLEEFKYTNSRKIVSRIIETSDDFSDSYSYF